MLKTFFMRYIVTSALLHCIKWSFKMDVFLGQHVTGGMQINASICMVKRIDTENEAAFIVPLEGGHGGWYSISALFPVTQAQRQAHVERATQ